MSRESLEHARKYAERGYRVVPIPAGGKAPTKAGWQFLRLDLADLHHHFYNGQGVGILTGMPSGGLVDVDLDCPEALELADAFLPPTGMVHGRPSKPRSHHWYVCYPPPEAIARYRDTDGATLLELRSTGGQTNVPPTLHPSGESLAWAELDEPARADRTELSSKVARTAACVLLARHWPQKGSRDELAMALSGALLRAGWSELDASHLIASAARTAGDEEARMRMQKPAGTVRRLATNQPTTGWPTVARLIGQEVTDRLREWLGVPLAQAVEREQSRVSLAGSAGFQLTHVSDLLGEDLETTSYVWQVTLPTAGLSILAAKPKVGKSTTVRTLAVKTARGEAFHDRATLQGPAVYLALEEKRAELQRLFLAMGAGEEPLYIIHTGAPLDGALPALGDLIKEYRPVLAIVDSLQDFARVRDLNDYSLVHHALAPVRDLARETGTHIMFLHHNNKGDDLLGSTQLFGIVDTLLTMRLHERRRTLSNRQRYGEDLPETVLELDDVTQSITAAGEWQEVQLRTVRDSILDALGGEELTEPDLRERVGGNLSLASKALRQAVQDGDVGRTGAGKRSDPYRYSKLSVPL